MLVFLAVVCFFIGGNTVFIDDGVSNYSVFSFNISRQVVIMAYIAKIINANDTRQGDALMATSPKNFQTLATVVPDGITFASVSGQYGDRWDDPRYYHGDLAT